MANVIATHSRAPSTAEAFLAIEEIARTREVARGSSLSTEQRSSPSRPPLSAATDVWAQSCAEFYRPGSPQVSGAVDPLRRARIPGSHRAGRCRTLTTIREPLETIAAFVDAFVAAWPSADASPLADFFTDEAVYRNGPLEPVVGRSAILATLESFMKLAGGVSVDMVHVMADGQLVMTERVDYFVADGRSIALPVLGVFELNGGQIAAWRDYFDLGQFTRQFAG